MNYKPVDMTAENPKLSVIMTVHDQAEQLESNLPKFLANAGETPYEVIVVDDSSTDDTPDVLKRLKTDYPQLYTTFLPFTNVLNPNRLRLGLTVGAKAAHGEWIAIADITRPPSTDNWVDTLVGNLDDRSEVLLAYDNKTKNIQSCDTLEDAAPYVYKAERKSKHGHRGQFLQYQRGLYSILLVKRQHIHELLKFFDQDIRGSQLAGLSFKVLLNNLFN